MTLLLPALPAMAAEACDIPPRYGVSEVAKAVVTAACGEHRLWYRPFIDRDGRIASLGVTEAENEHLADNGLIAWQRVAAYWRESATLGPMGAIAGASSCAQPAGNRYTDSDCRAFLIDNPWSAAFISWVMTRAAVPGFARSPRHIDYIRAAYQGGSNGMPYRLADPGSEKPAPGDMLCFLRDRSSTLNYSGLIQALGSGRAGNWKSHCEIVVSANMGGDRTLYLIGGNVANSVVMRKLMLDRTGLIELTKANAGSASASPIEQNCSPGHEEECNLNRQDWAALLKLTATNPAPAFNSTAPLPPPPDEPIPTPVTH
ncbi:DUF2272 domain-containing protein [Stenotrophomonas terrae]|uniref:DUF2272 domain-containing protein n=1 Tax=Stenotrophomonas terrae TaxID=405446 RepID=UPI003207AEF4